MRKPVIHISENNFTHHNLAPYVLEAPQRQTHNQAKIEEQLRHDFHIFILGAIIGGTIALFIAYHLHFNIFSYITLIIVPLIVAILLRKVYIHTLLNIWNESRQTKKHSI